MPLVSGQNVRLIIKSKGLKRGQNETKLYRDSSVNISDSSWHHLVGTLDRGEDSVKVYLDGELKKSTDGSSINGINDSGSPLMFGKTRTIWGPEPTIKYIYTGKKIDEVRVYNTALNADKIEALYNLEKPPGAKRGIPHSNPQFIDQPINGKRLHARNLLKFFNLEGQLRIYSLSGKIVLVKNINYEDFLDISSLNSGVYLLTLGTIKMKILR